MQARLPPGSRLPGVLQTLGWWTRPLAFAERLRARHGSRYILKLAASRPSSS